ncbi:sensor histidine kinase [Marinomonas transparens]|uniref:histidine kinase n=1 Tax=Marinomonas transparens TaxID=2795388 RepID=A0A934JYL3_9GAMM|nr:PAS domain-containing sensor histidine kinase [Marinomonas transparens]MBJ7539322.1 PAS domain S-box protein [Marinomonas transparens]
MDHSQPTESTNLFDNQHPVDRVFFLHQLIDYLPMGAMVVDTHANIILVNDELAHILGYSAAELSGMEIESLLPTEFQANHKNLMYQFFKNPRKRQMGVGKELYAKRKDGSQIPIEIGLNPVQGQEQPLVLATLIDLTPRLRANKMFQHSIQSAPNGVLAIDSKGIIRLANHSLCVCFGYSEDELLDQPMEVLLPERYRHKHHSLRHSFHQDPSVRMMGVGRDLTALHKDGREFPVEIGLSPFEDENNQDMVLVSLLDITERKRMEIELRENNTRLEEFTYVASHDLRSPLRGIADLLEWIKEDLGDETLPDVLNNINRIDIRIQRMEQLIENLLAYAKAGQATTNTQVVDINHLLDNVVELLSIPDGITLQRDIQLKTLVSSWTPLETVIRNLISNAIKHHDSDQGTILIRCCAENNLCHFSICDDGPGIPEAAYERIFRLFQTATSNERGSTGTGIGLSISRRLAESHGGRISVESNHHQRGVTFHVWWPRFLRKDTHD